MKFLLDENIGKKVALFLQKLGYSANRIRELQPGIDDSEVLDIANSETRILITSDKDFGELVFKEKQHHRGIILLRLEDEVSENKIAALEKVFLKYHKIGNVFITVTEKNGIFRIRAK